LATAAGFFSVEAGEARSQGLEVDANLAFENGTDLWFSYAYTNAEFTNSNPDADFGAQIEDGDSLINSPKNQVNLQLSRRLQLAGMPAQVGTGLQYTDERLGWTAFDFMLPSYTTVRFFGEIEPANNLTVRFDLDNAFDKEYYTNSYADVWVGPGMPRRYRLTASYAF
jgi:iron complex outermembrane receptor protein